MLKKEVEITIKTDGTVEADLQGFEGKLCEGAIDELLTVVGKKVKTTNKKEYFKKKKVQINTTLRRG